MSTKKKQWSEAEEKQLFELHLKHRNKWAQIAKQMPGKDYNSIKNKFYSTVRKGLRKINKYITAVKKKADPERFKAYKTLQDLFVVKLIAVADDHFDEKYEVKARAVDLATGIQSRMIEIACADQEYLQPHPHGYQNQEKLLADIQEFNKNCKRRKGKKKTEEERIDHEESSQSSSNHLLESEIIEDHPSQQIEINVIPAALKLEEQGLAKTTEEINVSQQMSQKDQKLIFSGFLGTLQKKESSSSGNFASLAAMRTEGFISKFTDFLVEDNVMVQSHGNLSQSNSWIYESSTTTRQMSKKMSNYMTEPSPHPTDPYSPYTFNNLMKKKNITTSNMFDDKSSCADILESEKTHLNNRDQNVISFVDHIPMLQPEYCSFLVKSADLRKENDNVRDQLSDSREYYTNSLQLDKKSTQLTFHQIIPIIENRRFEDNRSFASQYAFTDNTAVKMIEPMPINPPEEKQP